MNLKEKFGRSSSSWNGNSPQNGGMDLKQKRERDINSPRMSSNGNVVPKICRMDLKQNKCAQYR